MNEVADGEMPEPDIATPPAPDGTIVAKVPGLTGDQVTVPLVRTASATDATPVDIRYASGAAQVPPAPAHEETGWLSPTRTDLGTHAARDDDSGDLAPRSRRGWWIAAAAAVLLIIAGIVIAHARSNGSQPSDAVRAYFADLGAGDVSSAMALVDAAGTYTSSADPLLTPIAMARAADRPTHVAVTGTAATTTAEGSAATAVSVTYTVAGAAVHQTIAAVAGDASGPAYRLVAPFVTMAVTGAGSRPVTINGVAIPAGTSHTLAFPAAYTATTPGTRLISASSASAAYRNTSGVVQAAISLPAPALAADATTLIQAAVNHALAGCAASTAAAPAGCPFHYSDSSATMAWKIVAYPHVRVVLHGDSVTFDDGGHAATVQYSADTSYFFGLIPHTATGSITADVAGTASADHSTVTVTFSP